MSNIATSNKDVKFGWTSKYWPYSMYKISEDKVVLGGDNRDMDPTLLLRAIIKDKIAGQPQMGGSKELLKFSLKSKDIKGGFKKIESKLNQYLKKNNLDDRSRSFILTIEDLDDKKTFMKIYKNKI